MVQSLYQGASVLLLFTGASSWAAPELGCNGQDALLKQDLKNVELQAGQRLGEWRLAVSSERPDVLTRAKASLEIQARAGVDGDRWVAQLRIEFRDPEIIGGLGFNFSRARLEWHEDGGTAFADLDWTNSCTSLGPSLYPNRGPLVATFELPGVGRAQAIRGLRFRLWGSLDD